MTYSNTPNHYALPGAAERNPLEDREWRRRHSLWLLAPILGFGMFSFIGFVYVAIRVGSRKFWRVAAVYSLATVLAWTFIAATPTDSALANIGAVLILVLWIGGTIHAVVLNRDYLRWRATSRPWYTDSSSASYTVGQMAPQSSASPAAAVDLGAERYFAPNAPATSIPAPAQPAPTSSPAPGVAPAPTSQATPATQPVDVNVADSAALQAVPGLDAAWAAHIVSVREKHGRFTSLDDFARAVGMQPHQLARVRDNLQFAQAQPHSPRPTTGRGRILDV